jgi:2-aminoethylphosphonate-pyruvate transaminase
MAVQVSTAVILAAGMGTRLEAVGRHIPKGFIRLGPRPIIEESIDVLIDQGITEIIIVTGHLNNFYQDLASRFGGMIKTVYNRDFANSGSMFSLSLASGVLTSDFLLLESDIIYESRAVKNLINHPEDNVLILSGFTFAGDEVFVEASNGKLKNMSKDRASLRGDICGELVGISKISKELLGQLVKHSANVFKKSLRVDYEDALVYASRSVPIHCDVVPDLIWAEIDFQYHLDRAIHEVYPKLVKTRRVKAT